MLYAWIAKVHLSQGQEEEGKKNFVTAQTLAPYLPMLKVLRQEFPSLSTVPPPTAPDVLKGKAELPYDKLIQMGPPVRPSIY